MDLSLHHESYMSRHPLEIRQQVQFNTRLASRESIKQMGEVDGNEMGKTRMKMYPMDNGVFYSR